MSSEPADSPTGGRAGDRRYSDALFGPLFSTDALADATGDVAYLQAMLDVEAALALAGSDVGLVPRAAAEAIAAAAEARRYDVAAIGQAGRDGGNPVIPLVAALGRELGPADAAYVHLGATSQDILDSATMLVCRRAGALILEDLHGLLDAAAALAARHRRDLIAGRTLLQQAVPITFGLKAAVWLDGALDATEALSHVLSTRLAAQFGGAAGSLAPLGEAGPAVLGALAARLELAEPPLAWHANRTRIAELASALALVCGALAKIANDVALLMQTEVGEAFEPALEGRGGSSTMPHKRNPVGATLVNAAARRASALVSIAFSSLLTEHERGVGAWHAEFQTLGELARLAGLCAAQVRETLEGLEVDTEKMAANLDLLDGLPLAERVAFELGQRIGRAEARRITDEAARHAVSAGIPFKQALAERPEVSGSLDPSELERLLDPAGYLGSTEAFIERALRRAGTRTEEHDAHLSD